MAALPQATQMLHEVAVAVRNTLDAPEPDQIHDLRVAIRRFTQALALFDPGSKEIEKMRRGLKPIMKFAGGVRDYDITLKLAAKFQASKRFLAGLLRRRGEAERLLLAELKNWLDADTAAKWQAKLAGARQPVNATSVVSGAVKRLFKRGEAAEESDKELHPLRIAAKKLRYTLDLLRNADEEHRERMKDLQTRLGDINDFVTARRIAVEESGGKRLLSRLAKEHDRKVRAFHRYWNREFAGKKRKREWKTATLQAAPSRARIRARQGAA